MSSHDGFDEAVAAYALGALDEAERGAFETHLETCADCQRELAELHRLTMGLGMAAGAIEPPASLRARTLARATAQPQERANAIQRPGSTPAADAVVPLRPPVSIRTWAWPAIAAGIVVFLGLLGYIAALHSQIRSLQRAAADASTLTEDLRAELAEMHRHSGRLANTLNVLSAPDLIRIDLRGQPAAPAAVGRAFVSGARGVLFSAENLPTLSTDRTYQLWAVAPGAAPVSVGLFNVDAGGASSIPLAMPASLTEFRSMGVTVEPAGGSQGPTSAIVLAGTLAN